MIAWIHLHEDWHTHREMLHSDYAIKARLKPYNILYFLSCINFRDFHSAQFFTIKYFTSTYITKF